jgi:hypothetical protein
MSILLEATPCGRICYRSAAALYGAGTKLVRTRRQGKDILHHNTSYLYAYIAHHHAKGKIIVFIKIVK